MDSMIVLSLLKSGKSGEVFIELEGFHGFGASCLAPNSATQLGTFYLVPLCQYWFTLFLTLNDEAWSLSMFKFFLTKDFYFIESNPCGEPTAPAERMTSLDAKYCRLCPNLST